MACIHPPHSIRWTRTCCTALAAHCLNGVAILAQSHDPSSTAILADASPAPWLTDGTQTGASQTVPGFESACSIQGTSNCQPFDDANWGQFADFLSPPGVATADDFRPLGDTLTNVCVWGAYVGLNPDGSRFDCADSATSEFYVYVYSAGNDGLPDFPRYHSGVSPQNVVRTLISPSAYETQNGIRVFQMDLSLDTPITELDPSGDSVYWLEVSDAEFALPGPNNCAWNWLGRNMPINDFSVNSPEFGYGWLHVASGDFTFCVNTGLVPTTPVLRACCDCAGGCTLTTKRECDDAGKTWHMEFLSCTGACPPGSPPNDSCQVVAAGPTEEEWSYALVDTSCADTDGPSVLPTAAGDVAVVGDVWYKVIVPAGGPDWERRNYVETCAAGLAQPGRPDTFFAIYRDPDNPTVCTCPTSTDQPALLFPNGTGFNAETCTALPLPGGEWLYQYACEPHPGDCLMIRVGGVVGPYPRGRTAIQWDFGTGDVWIPGEAKDGKCFIGTGYTNTACESNDDCPTGVCNLKNRFLAYRQYDWNTSSNPLRIRFLNVPSSPALNGQVRWAGPPTTHSEGSTGGTFTASRLQCTPFVNNWSGLGWVYIFGPEIVPGAEYEISFTSDPLNECPPGFRVQTGRWGDVVEPYGAGQPTFIDISAIVRKFQGGLGARSKVFTKLYGVVINPASPVNFQDVSAAVDAFKSKPYPFAVATQCP